MDDEGAELLQPLVVDDVLHERLRLAAVRAVADGDRCRPVLDQERAQRVLGLLERGVALHEVDHRVLEELAGLVDDDALAARPLPRVDAEHGLGAERRREQQLPQILREAGINVPDRVARLRSSGGVPAVLREIAQIGSSSSKRLHYEELIKRGPILSEADAESVGFDSGDLEGDRKRDQDRRFPPRQRAQTI